MKSVSSSPKLHIQNPQALMELERVRRDAQRDREEEGADTPDHCASCKMTRAAPIYTPKGHMYSRGWTKVVGDIMGVQRGFQFHMRES